MLIVEWEEKIEFWKKFSNLKEKKKYKYEKNVEYRMRGKSASPEKMLSVEWEEKIEVWKKFSRLKREEKL